MKKEKNDVFHEISEIEAETNCNLNNLQQVNLDNLKIHKMKHHEKILYAVCCLLIDFCE